MKVSILIATYNHASWLEIALNSVLGQNFHDYEIIVVDDGSTDNTQTILENWHLKNADIILRVIKINNSGQSYALEKAFSQSIGDIICLLDSDDTWLPSKLHTVVTAFEQHPDVGMVVHPLYVINQFGQRSGDVRPRAAALSSGDMREEIRLTTRHVAPATSGISIRRKTFEKSLPIPLHSFKGAADAYLTFAATYHGPILAISDVLAEYRLHKNGQYIQRLGSVAGLKKQIDLQSAILNNFGLLEKRYGNSFFMRNEYAYCKMYKTWPQAAHQFIYLVRSLSKESGFAAYYKVAFIAYWSISLIMPRKIFMKMWIWFQIKQTGIGNLK